MTGGIEDPRFTEELLTTVLGAFEAAGYHRASDRHTVTVIGLLGELARIYAGERPPGHGISGAERAARRTVAGAIAADFRAERANYAGSGPVPDWATWALRLAGAVDLLTMGPSANDLGDDEAGGMEPYCRTCGEWAGLFLGLDGWQHFRGDPAPGGHRELYETGHEPVIGWCHPPGILLSPARVRLVLEALGRLGVLEGAVEGLRQDLAAAVSRIGIVEAARTQDGHVLDELLGELGDRGPGGDGS